jgi:signal transduction histidine kinase
MMEIVKIKLENEMDLILSHKRSMKLAELCGLSVLVQTTFATAVSEVSRCVIGSEDDEPTLTLAIDILRNNKKALIACISSNKDFERDHPEALKYARKLADDIKIVKHKKLIEIIFTQNINFSGLINDAKLQTFVNYFKKELPISPYDEIRKKNIQLIDISEKLRDSENQYRILTETLPLMIFTTNASGYITYGNKWLKDFFKLLDIEPGKHLWTSFLYASGNKNVKEEWKKSILLQTQLTGQATLKSTTTEELLWHLISITPVKNEHNQVVSWTGFFVNIHAQKLVEETLKNNKGLKAIQKQLLDYQGKLEEKVSELNKSNHDLEQFAYIASHDLQEPLRKIRNFSDLLEKNIHDEDKTRKYISKIDMASSRMLLLIKDVLNYSRLSKADKTFINISLQETLNNVKLDMELLIEEKDAVIKSTGLPVIIGIPLQLYQLFFNLISNSLKFSIAKPVISITCRDIPADEIKKNTPLQTTVPHIELLFKDNGIGFEQKYAKQIFTIFKRLNSKDAYTGTGIGLALCKKIVDNHNGLISVTSEVGKGTLFSVILPKE